MSAWWWRRRRRCGCVRSSLARRRVGWVEARQGETATGGEGCRSWADRRVDCRSRTREAVGLSLSPVLASMSWLTCPTPGGCASASRRVRRSTTSPRRLRGVRARCGPLCDATTSRHRLGSLAARSTGRACRRVEARRPSRRHRRRARALRGLGANGRAQCAAEGRTAAPAALVTISRAERPDVAAGPARQWPLDHVDRARGRHRCSQRALHAAPPRPALTRLEVRSVCADGTMTAVAWFGGRPGDAGRTPTGGGYCSGW